MATLKQAGCARDAHADALARCGAHAVGVEQHGAPGSDGWVVVAYVDPAGPADLPAQLATTSDGVAVDVPLVARAAAPFQPE